MFSDPQDLKTHFHLLSNWGPKKCVYTLNNNGYDWIAQSTWTYSTVGLYFESLNDLIISQGLSGSFTLLLGLTYSA